MNEFERRRQRGTRRDASAPAPAAAPSAGGQAHWPPRRKKSSPLAGLSPARRRRLALLCGGGAAALVLVIVLAVTLLSSCRQNESPALVTSDSGINSAASHAVTSTDLAYDKDADKVDASTFSGTVLPETADAGQDYIDETLFIGDSNTARMMSYGFTTLDNDIGIISMGIQMVPTKACVYFKGYAEPVTIPQAVKIMQPRRIIITFGTNNTIG